MISFIFSVEWEYYFVMYEVLLNALLMNETTISLNVAWCHFVVA
jgi:hypothetical protein